jgi:hypothetical protein
MICQGVYAVRCQIQRSGRTKPTVTAEAAAAAAYATAVVLIAQCAAKEQLSTSSIRSSCELLDEDRIAG